MSETTQIHEPRDQLESTSKFEVNLKHINKIVCVSKYNRFKGLL